MIKRYLVLALIYVFNCLPVKKNKIFLFSYYGSQYGCNPKYITEYILNNYPAGTFDVVWAFTDIHEKRNLTGFRKVKVMSLAYFYELCTSKVVITNYRTTDLFVKRKKQYYIQTWHSSLRLKQIENDADNSLPLKYIEMAKKDSLKCDLLLSGCKYSTEIFKRAFWYQGEIFECGTPRNDLLFQANTSLKNKVLESLNIEGNRRIVLYAPTFRKDKSLEAYNLNYSSIIEKLKSRFKGEWTVLVRLHPHLLSESKKLLLGEHVVDVTKYDDIQELLAITDILITDYSSLMFDFSITKRPCFLYIPDLNEYIKDRDLYFKIKELPFINAGTNQELIEKIEQFNSTEYNEKQDAFWNQVESYENGKASQRLLKRIEKICFNEKRSEKYEAKTV